MRPLDAAGVPLELVEGTVLVQCPDPGCDATLAGPGTIVTHHEDGSHTFAPPLVKIRLLTSIQGDGPVVGDTHQVLDVDVETAAVWADGVRAELVTEVPAAAAVAAEPVAVKRTRRRTAR